jgi:hypothetical protein
MDGQRTEAKVAQDSPFASSSRSDEHSDGPTPTATTKTHQGSLSASSSRSDRLQDGLSVNDQAAVVPSTTATLQPADGTTTTTTTSQSAEAPDFIWRKDYTFPDGVIVYDYYVNHVLFGRARNKDPSVDFLLPMENCWNHKDPRLNLAVVELNFQTQGRSELINHRVYPTFGQFLRILYLESGDHYKTLQLEIVL